MHSLNIHGFLVILSWSCKYDGCYGLHKHDLHGFVSVLFPCNYCSTSLTSHHLPDYNVVSFRVIFVVSIASFSISLVNFLLCYNKYSISEHRSSYICIMYQVASFALLSYAFICRCEQTGAGQRSLTNFHLCSCLCNMVLDRFSLQI